MIQPTSKCTGCGACESICPKHCITLQADGEGFDYPKVNVSLCVDCGLCEKVCHALKSLDERQPLKVLAAINKDSAIREASSSGGVFFSLAERIINEGGVVFGARFDDKWQVMLDYAETIDGIKPFMGSKYVQAHAGTAYRDAERFLKQGRKVLFSGSPCQISGLHSYLRKPYENLITVDFVCHGVPSPKVWGRYLDEVVSSFNDIGDVKFRSKQDGWKRFHFQLSYTREEKTVTLSNWHQQNHYMRAFLSDMILRPSCYQCAAKGGRSLSDITIGDFWGIWDVVPQMDDDRGTSLVLVHTEKGASAISFDCFESRSVEYDSALRCNHSIVASVKPHPKRRQFFAKLDKTRSVIDLIDSSLRPPLHTRIRRLLGRCKIKAIELLRNVIGGVSDR